MLTRELMLLPAVALVLLSALVWLVFFTARLRELRERGVSPEALGARAHTPAATAPSDNLTSLFEMPMLFYVLVLALYVAHLADTAHLVMAWVYVALRVLHSLIQLTYNRVSHRLAAFAASSVLLWVMWGRAALQLVERIADGAL